MSWWHQRVDEQRGGEGSVMVRREGHPRAAQAPEGRETSWARWHCVSMVAVAVAEGTWASLLLMMMTPSRLSANEVTTASQLA